MSMWLPPRQSPAEAGNTTADVLTSVPSQMLEAFVPGFGIVSRFLEVSIGIDVTAIVSALFVLVAVAGAMGYAGSAAWRVTRQFCTCSVTINSNDKLYEQVMYWLSTQNMSSTSRSLRATTTKDRTETGGNRRGRQQETSNFYFAEIESSTPPEYTPAYGWHRLWYKGSLIVLYREQQRNQVVDLTGWGSSPNDKEYLQLRCFGWSTKPLKKLLMECKRVEAELHRSTTTVRRSAQGQHAQWVRAITRPSRSTDTVFMDEQVKQSLMDDVKEYLDSSTPIFYARRGIPYRRGYLFHGPPGTGKTSLSFALAGTFGFELFTVSLKEPFMSEHKLTQLFSSLPSRCIVLLEDVDTAGLEKREESKEEENRKTEDDESAEENKKQKGKSGIRIRNETRQYGNTTVSTPAAEGVTLSGLLNAIDGVASQEGRILVLTTNDPEALDKALIRPGRIDQQVYFGHASRYQIRQIFYQMFARDDPKDSANSAAPEANEKGPDVNVGVGNYPSDQLEAMAEEFADILPETTFSPAEIQGYLLIRRKSPKNAIDDAVEWRDKLLAARAAGKNILEQGKPSPSPPQEEKPTINGVSKS